MSTRKLKSRKTGTQKLETLTVQQRMFVKLMTASQSMNPKEAAEKSGYKNPSVSASKLMKNPIIVAALGKEIGDREERTKATADDILTFLHGILDLDVTQIFDDNGYTTIKKLKSLPIAVRKCVQGLETFSKTVVNEEGKKEEREFIKVKWMSKDHALELALKHHGLLHPDLHIHVISDKMKTQLLTEILSQMSEDNDSDNIIDANKIERIAHDS